MPRGFLDAFNGLNRSTAYDLAFAAVATATHCPEEAIRGFLGSADDHACGRAPSRRG